MEINGACWAFVLISGGSSGNIESSGTPDPDQGMVELAVAEE